MLLSLPRLTKEKHLPVLADYMQWIFLIVQGSILKKRITKETLRLSEMWKIQNVLTTMWKADQQKPAIKHIHYGQTVWTILPIPISWHIFQKITTSNIFFNLLFDMTRLEIITTIYNTLCKHVPETSRRLNKGIPPVTVSRNFCLLSTVLMVDKIYYIYLGRCPS